MATVRADNRRATVTSGACVAHAAPVCGEPLLERERELAAIDRSIRRAASGRGAVVLIEGPAGIGKSSLLGAARKRCVPSGVQQLCARGGELEADVPLGVVRQLVEPVLLSAEASPEPLLGPAGRAALRFGANPGRLDEPSGHTYALFHSLYLLCVALARRSPVLATVDDAHLSDPPSLRFLDFLTTRLDDLPFVLVLAIRQDEASTDATALAELAASPLNTTLRPPALSQQAVESLVLERLRTKPEPPFARACHSVTGGNPFLVRELLTDLAHAKVVPTTASAAALGLIGPRTVADSAVLRLRGLSADAVALATAVALLGDGATFCEAAALAELSRERATLAADALVRAEILRSGRAMAFVHALERQAIYESLGHGERSRLHRKAASVVEQSDGSPDVIADHLLRVYPRRDQSVVEPLRNAARHALARGAPAAAVRYLRRALDERPTAETAAGVLLELGEAELLGGYGEAPERLAQAAATATATGRVLALRLLATARLAAGATGGALDAYRFAIAAAGELRPDVQLQLRAELLAAAQSQLLPAPVAAEGPGRIEPDGLGNGGIGECLLVATLAVQAMRRDQKANVAAADIQRALAGAALRERLPIESPALHVAATGLCEAEAFDSAQSLMDRIAEHPRASTSMFIRAAVSARRADLAFRRGSLDQAEAEARVSLDCSRAPDALGRPLAAAVLIEVLLEKDDPRAAENLLQRDGIADAPPAELTCAYRLYARARVRVAQDHLELALQDLLECGDRLLAGGAINPAIVPWRSLAALAQHRLGERQASQRLADEELALARRFGAPRATGIALRTVALVHDGAPAVEMLRDAVSVLERSGARLEYARALADLGAAERRAGRRRHAREHLEQGHRIAVACGGTALAGRCREELAAASGRLGTASGDAGRTLTASEQRVAGLAAEGRSNHRIAQTLCISHKTVEKHLHNAYVKLGIGSRSSLADVLGAGSPYGVGSEAARPRVPDRADTPSRPAEAAAGGCSRRSASEVGNDGRP